MRRQILLLIMLIWVGSTAIEAQNTGQKPFGRPRSQSEPAASPSSPTVAAPGRVSKSIEITVDSARPLARAAEQLRYKFGQPISYEDIEWINRDDLTAIGQLANPNNVVLKNPEKLGPAAGSLLLRLDVDSNSHMPITPLADLLTKQ